MNLTRVFSGVVTPTVEMALDRFDAEWTHGWFVYGEEASWKDPNISSVYVRIEGLAYIEDGVDYREYQVRAIKQETAIERMLEWVRSPFPLVVTAYKVQLPLSVEMLGVLEAENARLRREPKWLFPTVDDRRGSVGSAGRAGGNRLHVSSVHRRPVSVGML